MIESCLKELSDDFWLEMILIRSSLIFDISVAKDLSARNSALILSSLVFMVCAKSTVND